MCHYFLCIIIFSQQFYYTLLFIVCYLVHPVGCTDPCGISHVSLFFCVIISYTSLFLVFHYFLASLFFCILLFIVLHYFLYIIISRVSLFFFALFFYVLLFLINHLVYVQTLAIFFTSRCF